MKITSETKFFLGIIIATFAIIGLGIAAFSRPAPALSLTREQLIPSGANTRGNPQANVYLVEFSDFQCPACKAFQPVVDDLVNQYQDKIYYAFRHFPLPGHPLSFKSAQAAEAAGRQGKFWQMADLIFENQDQLSSDIFINLARELNLDENKFQADLNSAEVNDLVAGDKSDAENFQIRSTPSFFLNGELLLLNTPEDLNKIIEEAFK